LTNLVHYLGNFTQAFCHVTARNATLKLATYKFHSSHLPRRGANLITSFTRPSGAAGTRISPGIFIGQYRQDRGFVTERRLLGKRSRRYRDVERWGLNQLPRGACEQKSTLSAVGAGSLNQETGRRRLSSLSTALKESTGLEFGAASTVRGLVKMAPKQATLGYVRSGQQTLGWVLSLRNISFVKKTRLGRCCSVLSFILILSLGRSDLRAGKSKLTQSVLKQVLQPAEWCEGEERPAAAVKTELFDQG
jgi:hypothetical protein